MSYGVGAGGAGCVPEEESGTGPEIRRYRWAERTGSAWSEPPATDWPVSAEIFFHNSDLLGFRA
ncbi:hypothetical protein GCM10023080_098100 [Streptomyces pseudoechinosporeus]